MPVIWYYEDREPHISTYGDALKRAGYEVHVTKDHKDILKAVEEAGDEQLVLLLDQNLSASDAPPGEVVARTLKRKELRPHIVFLTSLLPVEMEKVINALLKHGVRVFPRIIHKNEPEDTEAFVREFQTILADDTW